MNIKIILLLMILAPATYSIELIFDQMRESNIEASWELDAGPNSTYSAVLDCQSFFHKLDFIHNPSGDVLENVISPNECEEVYYKVTDCLKSEGEVCIDSENYLNNSCYCKKD